LAVLANNVVSVSGGAEVPLIVAPVHLGGIFPRSLDAVDAVQNSASQEESAAGFHRRLVALKTIEERASWVAPLNLHIGRCGATPGGRAVEDLVAKDGFADVPILVRQRSGARGIR